MLTTAAAFLEKTSLVIDVLIDAVLAETRNAFALTPAQITWFASHCDQRFRYFHANNPKWRKWLEDRNSRIDPRNQCKVWIRHWLAAYMMNPGRYETQHLACPACGRVDEFWENRSDGFVWRECVACGFKSEAEKPAA